MFAEQRRLGNYSGARQAQPEIVESGEAVRQRPRRAGPGPSETCGLSQRPKVSKRKATDGRKERVANTEIRSVLLPPSGTAPLPVQVVHVSEPEPRRQTSGSCGRRFSKTQCRSSTGTLGGLKIGIGH